MINTEKLAKDLIYYRSINKLSINKLANKLEISINTMQKILKNQYVKEVTSILVAEKFENLKKEGDK